MYHFLKWCHVLTQDLVKSHLMYAVREEVEVLKEQIKELYERNSVLERENAVLKSLSNSEQLSQLTVQSSSSSSPSSAPVPGQAQPQPQPQPQPYLQLDSSQSADSLPRQSQPSFTSAWSSRNQSRSLGPRSPLPPAPDQLDKLWRVIF